eukprot:gene24921-30108_t
MEGVLARVSDCIDRAECIRLQEGPDNYSRAEEIFSTCLAILPQDAVELRALALGGLGRSLAGQGRFPFAESILKEALWQTSILFRAANDPVRRLSLYGRIQCLVVDLGMLFVQVSAEGVHKAWRSVGWLLLGINTADLVDIDSFPVHEDFVAALEAFLAAIWPHEVLLSIPRLSELALWVSTLCKMLDRAPFAARVYEVAVERADIGDLLDENMWELQRLRRDYVRSLLESAVTAADRTVLFSKAEAQLRELSNNRLGGVSLGLVDAKLWAQWLRLRSEDNSLRMLENAATRMHQELAEGGRYRWFGYYDTGAIEGVAMHDVEWWGPEEFNANNVVEAEEWITSLVNQWQQSWHWQALCYVNSEPLPEAESALVETTESESCPPGFQPPIEFIDVAGDICGGSTFGEFKENLPRSGTEIWNKWVHPGNIETSWVEYSYFEPIELTAYGVCSANDCPHRDPVAWKVSVREVADGIPVWKTVHVFERNDNVFPERWQWKYFTFAQELICDGFRLEITAVRAAGDSIQLGHLHVFGTPVIASHSQLSASAESAVIVADQTAQFCQAEAQPQQLPNNRRGGLPLTPANAKLWADAEFTLGLAYANGLGMPLNYLEAAKWFQQAADRGHANARSGLIWLYANGNEGGHGGEVSKFEKINRLHQGRAEGGRYRWFGHYLTGTIEGVATHVAKWRQPADFNYEEVLEVEKWLTSLKNQWQQPWHWQALCYVNSEPLPEAESALVETMESGSCPPGFQPPIEFIDVAGDICGGSTFGEFKENLPRSGTEIWNKWVHPGNIETSWVEYSYFEPIELTAYGVCSANDCPHRDPVAWKVSVREVADGIPVWKTVHVFERNDNVFPERWQWKYFTFARGIKCNGFRLEITAVRAAGGNITVYYFNSLHHILWNQVAILHLYIFCYTYHVSCTSTDSIQLGHLHVFGTPWQK